MEVSEILNDLSARGLRAEIRAGVLLIGPRALLDDDLRELVSEHRADIMAALATDDIDVRWRLANMLDQLLPIEQPGPVPILTAYDEVVQYSVADCSSCGELRDTVAGDTQICGACCRAKAMAIELWLARPARMLTA